MDLTVHSRIEEAATLPAAFYKDPAMYASVRERVFARSWQFIGDSDEVRVPGAVKPFTLLEGSLDEPMVLTRDMGDRLHLLSNVCTHRGMQVVEGCGNERHLRCRYHGRRFSLDGKFQHMPEFAEACDFPTASDNLATVPFGSWAKLLFGGVAPETSFEETFGPIIERLAWLPIQEFVPRPELGREYVVRANWALYVDNYLEGFHIPFVHASLNETIDYANYYSELGSRLSLQLAYGKPGEEVFQLPGSSADAGKPISAYYYWVFPNTMLNFYPWGLSVNVVRPLGPELMKVAFMPYVWREELMDRGAGAGLDRVEREDESVVELVQRGVKSRFYDRGRFSPTREKNVWHFHRMLGEFLAGS